MSPARLPPLPPSYLLEGDGRSGWLAAWSAARPALRRVGFGLTSDGAVHAAPEQGRGALVELLLDDVDGRPCRALVRHHRRGGLPARLGLVAFADPARPFDELALSEALRARGVATPRVLAARAATRVDARGHRRGGYDLALVTERVEGAVDVFEALRTARGPRRHALVRAAGRFVAQLFDAGLDHSDLHPKNLLVEERADGACFHVVDLDRSRLVPAGQLTGARRRDQLARLLRFCLRRRAAIAFTRVDALRFLLAHLQGAPWRSDFRTLARRAQRRIAFTRRAP